MDVTTLEQRVAVLESQQKTFTESLKRMEGKLDRALSVRGKQMNQVNTKLVSLEQQRKPQSIIIKRCFEEIKRNSKHILQVNEALQATIAKLDNKIEEESESRQTFEVKVKEKFDIGRGIWIAVTIFGILFGGLIMGAIGWGIQQIIELHYDNIRFNKYLDGEEEKQSERFKQAVEQLQHGGQQASASE